MCAYAWFVCNSSPRCKYRALEMFGECSANIRQTIAELVAIHSRKTNNYAYLNY